MNTYELLAKLDAASSAIEYVKSQLQRTTAQPPPSIAIEEQAGVCHWCKKALGSKKPIRGLHPKCHQAFTRSDVTEADAISTGRLAPEKPRGRKRNALTQEIVSQIQALAKVAEPAPTERKSPKRPRDSKS